MALIAFCFSCTFLILELIMPEVFYLNLAIASLLTGGALLFGANAIVATSVFVISLIGSFLIVRPKIKAILGRLNQNTKIKELYIGKIAQVVENTDKDSGILSINDERWQARTVNNETIEKGQQAKITNYKDIVMYIERV